MKKTGIRFRGGTAMSRRRQQRCGGAAQWEGAQAVGYVARADMMIDELADELAEGRRWGAQQSGGKACTPAWGIRVDG